MILFRLISWPYLRGHAFRSILTVLGISIGVAVFVAMHAANTAVFGAFQQTMERIAGATQLQVTAGEPGFDEEVLERVQSHRDIRAATPVVEAVVSTGLPGQGNLLILGVDMTGDRSLRHYDLESGETAILEDPLVFLAQPDSIMITTDFAGRNHLATGSKLPLQTIDGVKQFTVRGILKQEGLGSAFGGNLAIMDVYAAQYVFGRGRKFDRIDIAVTEGVDPGPVAASLEQALGPAFQVQSPASRGQGFQSIQRIYYFMLNFSSAFALVIGMFIIYNSFFIAVTLRRSEIGILRALGATRGQIMGLFLGESFVAGLAGALIGIFIGQAGAAGLSRVLQNLLQGVYGVTPSAFTIAPDPSVLAISAGLGIATSMIAAFLPARYAAGVDPVKALQKGRLHELSEGGNRVRLAAAMVSGAAGLALIIFTRSMTLFYFGYGCFLVAVLLATPHMVLGLGRLLRPLLKFIRPVEGALAADSLLAAPRRTSATVAALMLSLALVVGLAGSALGAYANISGWMSTALNPDLFVTSSESLTARTYRFPDSMGTELESIPEVDQVQRIRSARITIGGGQVLLLVVETRKMAKRSPRIVLEGDPARMYERVARGEAVLASENFAALRHQHVGDVVNIPSPRGVLALPIAGVVREYSDQQGSLFLDRAVFKENWRDDSVDLFRLYVAQGANPAAVKERILTQFAGNRRVFVLQNAEARAYITSLTNQWFGLTWIQVAIAVVVAALGIMNSLTVSISDRRRELGVLKAVGALRQQVRNAIWMEAAAVGFLSVLLGLLVGAVHLYCSLELGARDYPGLRFDYIYPYGVAGIISPVVIGVAVLAALAPAESAVREPVMEALAYE